MKILETERMVLRTFEYRDLDNLCQLHYDEGVMRYLVGGKRTTERQVAGDLHYYMLHQDKYGYSKWAILHKASGAFMGRAGFMTMTQSEKIDVDVALHARFWRQGYAREMGSAMLAWAIENLPIENVIGATSPQNKAGQQMMKTIGMVYDHDMAYFGIKFKVFRFGARPPLPGPAATSRQAGDQQR